MASNSKKNKQTEETAPTTEAAEANTPSGVAHEKIGAKILFAEYEEKDAALQRVQRELDMATFERSQAVKKIFDNVGKGPFRYKGSVVTVVARTTTSTDGDHTTYFFKGQKLAVQDVD